jgi:two-component system cell cycle response regulator
MVCLLTEKKIAVAKRHNVNVCLMVIDIDYFKKVNDTHGHAVGDAVLSQVAESLAASVRNEDIVARYGGEEFVVILDHCPLDAAIEKANRLRETVEKLKPENLKVTASFGVTQYNRDALEDFSALFSRADKALYDAKESGRNKVATA